MSRLFTVHTAVVGGISYHFLCKPVTYEGISNRVGVEAAGGDVGNIPLVRVSELLRKKILLRVNLYWGVLVGNRYRRRVTKVLCHPSKMKEFMFQARGLNYRGGIVETATTTTKKW